MDRRAVGGIVGPVTFLVAWAWLGARRDGYSPIDDPISRLAAVGAPTQVAMTTALLVFGVGVGLCAVARHRVLGRRPSTVALGVTAAAAFGVAATPLDSSLGGAGHAVAVALAYGSLAAAPLLDARERRRGRAAAVSAAVGAATGLALVASVVASTRLGLLQRAGLTIGHGWIVGTAIALLRPVRVDTTSE